MGAIEQRLQVVVVERLQHVHRRARQQRRVDLERRVLGGRADEGQESRLDMRQEGVLLALVEAVDLVDEDDRRPARAARRLRPLDRLADVLDAAEHRRHGDELGVEGVGHEARQRRLAGARRTPEDHRVQPPGLEGDAQRLARAEQVALADHLVERLRPQPFGERRGGGVGEAELERGLGHGSRPAPARREPILPRRRRARQRGTRRDIRSRHRHAIGRCPLHDIVDLRHPHVRAGRASSTSTRARSGRRPRSTSSASIRSR